MEQSAQPRTPRVISEVSKEMDIPEKFDLHGKFENSQIKLKLLPKNPWYLSIIHCKLKRLKLEIKVNTFYLM